MLLLHMIVQLVLSKIMHAAIFTLWMTLQMQMKLFIILKNLQLSRKVTIRLSNEIQLPEIDG